MSQTEWPSERTAAFTAQLSRAHAALIGFVRGVMGQDDDAPDVVQDVFVDAFRAARREVPPFTPPEDEAAIRRWLFHAAYCRAISLRRRQHLLAWESLDGDGEEGSSAVGQFDERIAEAETLRTALATLEDEEAACLMLHVVQGYTSVEIARTLHIAPDAARKRLSRALQRLRSAYFAHDQQGQESPIDAVRRKRADP